MPVDAATAPLPYHAAFDVTQCADLLAVVMASFGVTSAGAPWCGLRGTDPIRTYRQVARTVAVEVGFDPICVGQACDVSPQQVKNSMKQLAVRLARQQRPIVKRRSRNCGDSHPLQPTLDAARAAAVQWRKNLNNAK